MLVDAFNQVYDITINDVLRVGQPLNAIVQEEVQPFECIGHELSGCKLCLGPPGEASRFARCGEPKQSAQPLDIYVNYYVKHDNVIALFVCVCVYENLQ